ncbi:MAG: DNA polymerase III subunit beta [Bacteroidaceae bacterium]|nr:DNA polymerase III subunit beta [Bacteroidaceae bacterium]
MNFKVSSTALNSRITSASKVLASKNSMPILDCFLLEVMEGQLQVTASDSEKCYITTLPILEQEGTGQFCVPAKTLMDSLREIPEQPISLEINDNTLELKGRHSSGQFTIMAQDAAAYPAPRPVTEGNELNIPSEVLLNGINRCLFATANDEVRMVMNGIFFDMKQDHIIFAGTDGRKLVKNTIRSVAPGIEGSFILPKKVATILKNVLSRDEQDVHIKYTGDRATITTEDMTMHFRLIDGNYPNYNAVIPTTNPYRATIDRQALSSALKRVSVFCNQSSGLVKLELTQNSIRLTGQDNEYATSAEEYLTCDYNNNAISIGFSCQFLIEICNILDGESIILELADPSRPGVVRPAEEKEDEELLMLLMPMRVED